MAFLWILAGLAAAAGAQDPTSLEVATRLLDENPDTLSDLEAILGPLDRDAKAWEGLGLALRRTRDSGPIEVIEVTFDIDIYHQDPARRNPLLGTWDLTFRDGREEILELLETRLGPSTLVGETRVFGRFFLRPRGGDRCSLAWYRSEPEWAKPTRSKAETTALQRDLVRLLSEDQISRPAIEEIFGPLEFDPDWNCDHIVQPTWKLETCPAEAERPVKVTVSFDHDRPLPGTEELLRALGFTLPVVISTDVHMTTRELVESATLARPRLRGRQVSVSVADQGLVATDRQVPGSLVWRATSPMVLSIRLDAIP